MLICIINELLHISNYANMQISMMGKLHVLGHKNRLAKFQTKIL